MMQKDAFTANFFSAEEVWLDFDEREKNRHLAGERTNEE